ncbi:hypothetical protein JW992_06740 [candidate division KSB1 bacterium]|nr:hypothetical protein [candidate division KSB1 bacterium]
MKATGLHKKLNSRLDKAIWQHHMFSDGDRILVAVSGGADSTALLYLLKHRLSIYGQDLKLYAVYVDLGFGHSVQNRCRTMQAYFDDLEIPGQIVTTTIGPIAHQPSNCVSPCFLCSRIRRKKVFETAERLDVQRIVFGHHKDDVVETLLLNMIFSREISSMIPHLRVLGGRYSLVRPFYYTEEKLIKRFVLQKQLAVIDQECPTDGNSQRQTVKNLVDGLERDYPGARENLFKSLLHVKSDYLLQNAE